MKAVIQRVEYAKVSVDGITVGSCKRGLMILLGVADGDTEKDAEVLARKITAMRIFEDENDKMNLSLIDVKGEMLVISQFTLLANYKKGNRPDYLAAAAPQCAKRLYEYFVSLVRENVANVGMGQFGAHMKVELLNDGPVTIVADSKDLIK